MVIALLGTTLSCLNTGVRVSYAMGKDREIPSIFGLLHGNFRTPHLGVIILTAVSAIIGSYGVLNVDNLTQVTLVSNIGTLLLYGMTCIICVVAFAGVAGRNVFSTIIAPVLGATLNILLLFGVIYYAITTNGVSTQSGYNYCYRHRYCVVDPRFCLPVCSSIGLWCAHLASRRS